MMRISSKVLVDDIGVPVPVVKGSPGIWPNDSVCCREILHDSWRCFARGWGLGAVPMELGECSPVSTGGFGISFLELSDGAEMFTSIF